MPADLVCFSHLRWDGVTQRPQHLIAQARRGRRVFVVEEPLIEGGPPQMRLGRVGGTIVATPVLAPGLTDAERQVLLAGMVRDLLAGFGVDRPWLWFWTPVMLPWAEGIDAEAIVYDCMDELRGFRFAPAELVAREDALLAVADVVFTGGHSLYEAKRHLHPRVHAFPSSVDVPHFRAARRVRSEGGEPGDQAAIPRPRVGWYGVIDERFDGPLVQAVADAHPDWQFVLLGPVVKIGEEELPHAPNIHLLGARAYEDLPAYLGGWDVAIMPFAHNEATRFISPTKTPEYLAGGVPVVSTPIRDVVEPYGSAGLVRIAADADAFGEAIAAALDEDRGALARRADAFLADQSWAVTWRAMEAAVERAAGLDAVAEVAGQPAAFRTPPVPAPAAAGLSPAAAAGPTSSNPGRSRRLPSGAAPRAAAR